jgi:DNA-binding NarL/FixJ family response regulator
VPDSRALKLLLVEDDLEDEQLLCEALIEIEEQRQWCNWRSSSIVQVERLADALDCLRRQEFDVILLNLSLPDSPVLLDSFLETNAAAEGAPIVVLADAQDDNLANWLLREGAQDVLLKSELECAPLARSLRYAIERQRKIQTLRASPFLDELTGALTAQAFFTMAGHSAQLSRHHRPVLLAASVEISDLSEKTQDDREVRELVLIRAAEVLRETFQSPALVGRLAQRRFGMILAGMTAIAAEDLLQSAVLEIEAAARSQGQPRAAARFSIQEVDLDTGVEQQFTAGVRQCAKAAILAD